MNYKLLVLLIGILYLCFNISAFGQKKFFETYIQTGDNAMTQKQYGEAEQAYSEALKLAEKFKEKDPRKSSTLIKLAESMSYQSKRDEAEALADRALAALDTAVKASKSKDPKERFYMLETSVLILDKAATIFVAGQKNANAEIIYKKVIALREEALQPKETPKSNEDFLLVLAQGLSRGRAKLAEAYDKLASIYFRQRRFEEAELLFVKALKAWESEYGADKPLVAIGMSRLATVYAMQGKYDKAEPLYSRAISIFEKTNWLDRTEAATAFENYALLLKLTGREAEAATKLEKAKEIRSKIQRSTN